MVKQREGLEKFKYILMGMGFVIGLLILLGSSSTPHIHGRYQISSWGSRFGENSGGCGAFIVDTMTGETKTAYTLLYGDKNHGEVERVNNLRKPFNSIK